MAPKAIASLLVAASLFVAVPALAEDYCVSTTGSDGATGLYNGGVSPACWATFARAVRSATDPRAKCGDRLYIQPGIYRQTLQLDGTTLGNCADSNTRFQVIGLGTPANTEISSYNSLAASSVTKTTGNCRTGTACQNVYQFDLPDITPGGIPNRGRCMLTLGGEGELKPCSSDGACTVGGDTCRMWASTMRERGQPTDWNTTMQRNGSDIFYNFSIGNDTDWCRAATLATGLAYADAVGTGARGSMTDMSGNSTIYFRPMNGGDPRTGGDGVQREYEAREYALYITSNYVHFSNLSFVGTAVVSGVCLGATPGTCGGRNFTVDGRTQIYANSRTNGLAGSVYEDFKVRGGIAFLGQGQSNPGFTARNFENSGGYNGISAGGFNGGPGTSRVVFDKWFTHNAWTNQATYYNCTTGVWVDKPLPDTNDDMWIGGHGFHLDASSYVTFKNGLAMRNDNSLGVFTCSNCEVLNNTFGHDGESPGNYSIPGVLLYESNTGMVIRGNLFFNSDTGGSPVGTIRTTNLGGTDIPTADYNVYFHSGVTNASNPLVYNRNAAVITLAAAKAGGFEGPNSVEFGSTSCSGGPCPTFVNRGATVNNYNLVAGNPAINAGGPAATCAHTASGLCDAGAFESGAGTCGNGTIDAGEVCDGTNLGTATCINQTPPFPPGCTLACSGCTAIICTAGCSSSTACSDGLDNDGDGFCDVTTSPCTDGSVPGDLGCTGTADATEGTIQDSEGGSTWTVECTANGYIQSVQDANSLGGGKTVSYNCGATEQTVIVNTTVFTPSDRRITSNGNDFNFDKMHLVPDVVSQWQNTSGCDNCGTRNCDPNNDETPDFPLDCANNPVCTPTPTCPGDQTPRLMVVQGDSNIIRNLHYSRWADGIRVNSDDSNSAITANGTQFLGGLCEWIGDSCIGGEGGTFQATGTLIKNFTARYALDKAFHLYGRPSGWANAADYDFRLVNVTCEDDGGCIRANGDGYFKLEDITIREVNGALPAIYRCDYGIFTSGTSTGGFFDIDGFTATSCDNAMTIEGDSQVRLTDGHFHQTPAPSGNNESALRVAGTASLSVSNSYFTAQTGVLILSTHATGNVDLGCESVVDGSCAGITFPILGSTISAGGNQFEGSLIGVNNQRASYTVNAEKNCWNDSTPSNEVSCNGGGSACVDFTPQGAGCSTLDTIVPSAITDLAAAPASISSCNVTWHDTGDEGATGNFPNVAPLGAIDLRYRKTALGCIDNDGEFLTATPVLNVPAPGTAGAARAVVVSGLEAGTEYCFGIKIRDEVPTNWSPVNTGLPKKCTTLTNNPPITNPQTVTGAEIEGGGVQ